jgi:hypothetical protein
MLGNALEEEAGCHRTCKALQEKNLGVVLEGNLIVVDYGYSRGSLRVWDGSYNYKILLTRMSVKNSPAL